MDSSHEPASAICGLSRDHLQGQFESSNLYDIVTDGVKSLMLSAYRDVEHMRFVKKSQTAAARSAKIAEVIFSGRSLPIEKCPN